MMRKIFVAILMLCGTLASAKPISVQTGEHPSFTRMVFHLSADTNWQLGRVDQGYMLQTSSRDGFDLRRFYDRIPRNRVTRVDQVGDDRLRISVPCDCQAEAFLLRPDILVVDVHDGSPSQGSPYEEPFHLITDGWQTTARKHQYVLPNDAILPLLNPASSATRPAFESAEPVVVDDEDEHRGPIQEEDLDEFEDSIVQSLARGLTQGALDRGKHDARRTALDDMRVRQRFDGVDVRLPGLTAHTNIDSAAMADVGQGDHTQSGSSCLPDTYFNIENWADDRPFSTQLADARGALSLEFDENEETEVLRLARFYAYFGFGLEAIDTLEIDGSYSQERLYLTQIAHILDGTPATSDLFVEQVSCPSYVSLWAMLAMGGALDAKPNRAGILKTFKTLPTHLQQHLGPRLSDRFVAMGDDDAAIQVLASIHGYTDIGESGALPSANLANALSNDDKASEILGGLARENKRMSPEAMMGFLNDAIVTGIFIEEADFILADALRYENARSPIAHDLVEVQFNARLGQNQFEQALELVTVARMLTTGSVDPMYAAFAQRAAEHMTDADFLEFAFGSAPDLFSNNSRQVIARRLSDLGFSERAIAFDNQVISQIPVNIAIPKDEGTVPANPVSIANPDIVLSELPSSTPLNNETPLASSRILVGQSQETRELVADILDRAKLPER
ncbi:hypothetical protein [Yoonia maritima]|uniref:hypothetical protein n=1 Tax=Yoonia maritima TaxID=1435347 RepID=UPI0037358DD1